MGILADGRFKIEVTGAQGGITAGAQAALDGVASVRDDAIAAQTASELARDQAADLVSPENIFVAPSIVDARAAGEADTTEGTYFKAVDTTSGIAEVRVRTAGGSDYLYMELTGESLGSNQPGMGLDLIGQPTVQQLLASQAPARGAGESWNADGFRYREAASDATDHHVETAGGVKLYVTDDAISPDALGSPCDGVGDDAPFIEKAFQLSPTVKLRPTSKYRLASIIGLPDSATGQDLYAARSLNLFCNGADIIVSSPEVGDVPQEIFTSAAAKLSPNSTANLYTGKLFVTGGNWTQETTSALFNGDRIYQLIFTLNTVDDFDTIVKSFRARVGGYSQGYVQSVSMSYNQLSGVRRIIDAKRAFDISFENNKGSSCLGGIYIDGPSNPAVNSFRWKDNLWQGGGLAFKLGQVIGGEVSGGYNENNMLGDAATAKCDFWLANMGGPPSSGVLFSGLFLQPSGTQITDTEYVSIRIDQQGIRGLPKVQSCYSTGPRVVTPGRAIIDEIGSNDASILRQSGSPLSPQSARRTTFGGSFTFLASSNLSAGVFRIASIDVQYLKSMLSDIERLVSGQIDIKMQHKTAGGIVNGVSHAVISFIAMAASEGQDASRRVDDVYATFTLMAFEQIAAGQQIDTQFNASTKTHFTAPALSVTRNGDKFDLKLSGYAAPTNPNWGSADRILSHITVQADARNNSSALTSPITLGS